MAASSPCTGLCVMDNASGQCRGCGRSLAEIAAWGRFSEAQRQAVMAMLEQRVQIDRRDPEPSGETGRAIKPDLR